MSIDLTAIGWTARLADAFAPHAAEGLIPARVALEHTHIYRVFTEGGEWLARVSGRLRHQAAGRVDFPGVGDWVALEPPVEGADARIRAVLPRRSRFSRRAAGDPTEEQIVAANIDTVFLVSGLDGDFNPRRIERYLVVASDSGAVPVVVLNKMDLVEDLPVVLAEVVALAPGIDVHAVSCRRPESLDVLRRYLGHGQTGALLGSSGVGKSSIVNQLIGHELLRTREVRASDSRGRHVSTARQLVMLPGEGVLIDTPGMRELQLWSDGESAAETFDDINVFAPGCHFSDCEHRGEPRCAVRAAVDDGRLAPERLEGYVKLQEELAHLARQQSVHAQLEEKRRSKVMGRALRQHLRTKGRDG
jgi:ribosome biogenesis GTPase